MQEKTQPGDSDHLAHPENWRTGDEPMTRAQKAYADTLAKEAGEEGVDDNLTKAEASQKIEQLRREVGLADTPST